MLAIGKHGVEVAFCPVQSAAIVDVLSKARADNHSQHHDAHAAHLDTGDGASQGSDQGQDQHSQHARSSACPFALAGSPILAATTPVIAVSFIHVDFSRPPDVATPPGVVPFERNRIRGPPYLA
jgi:hypothetical protein